MTPQMYHERGALRESLVTVRALVRLLPCVRATVYTEIILRDEALAADVADMRLLASVLAQMHRQVGLAGHGLAAHRTHVLVLRSDITVRPHVHQQHLFARETLVAELAVMLPLRRHVVRLVQLGVQPQALTIAEGSAANVALKRLVTAVRQQMHLAVALALKTLATYLALVLVIEHVAPLMRDQALPDRGSVTAMIATVTVLSKVLFLVLPQLGGRRETAAAILAHQLIILRARSHLLR